MEDLLPDFLAETFESLERLDKELITLERQPDDQPTLGSIFRHVHTIKGTCGFLGLVRLEKVAHAAENVLGRHRDGSLPVTPASITLVLRAIDVIRMIVDSIRTIGKEPEGDDMALIDELAAMASGKETVAAVPDRDTGTKEPPAPAPVIADAPAAMTADAPAAVTADAPAAEVRAPAEAAAPPPPATAKASAPASASASGPAPDPSTQTIRVNVDVLEGLMTLVSELVLTRNQILQLARTQDNETFAGPLQRLSHITSDLQEGVMKTRMQPIGNAWNNLPRLVRELSREVGKKIDLEMQGAATELDRQVLELIKDPLTHMVRNSADHGLETPADRRAAGKPESGRITLNAFHEGGHIVIEVGDDGRGLPVERIRQKIIGNGLASEADLATMTAQQIQSFIFRAGFSTAAAVTSVSGRGVGMDVVKTNIERIGGTIELASEPGAGTLFTMKIPLTLAIVSALIVEVGGERFAIPQISVVELVRTEAARAKGGSDPAIQDAAESPGTVIERINDTPVLRLRDHLLPLVNLSDLLEFAPMADASMQAGAAGENLYIVVVQVGASRFGLIVDRVFDTEEIVVKPVAPILRHITLFSGNTILGDGSVIMILDPNGIARVAGIGAARGTADTRPAAVVDNETSDRTMALLLFKSGSQQAKAVPLSLVSRLESIARSAIEYSSGQPVTQYRGKIMPLVAMNDAVLGDDPSALQPVLVFADGSRVMGLMVDEIVDVREDQLKIELMTDQPGFLGTAIVGGRATDILDISFWLKSAFKDWFGNNPVGRPEPRTVLVVEDSPFFRSLIIPALSSEGYTVTAVEHPLLALAMRDAGRVFDLILSDIEMPEMDGLTFAREVRSGGSWAKLPMLALTSRTSPTETQEGRDAGFDGYLSKFDKEVMIAAVKSTLAGEAPARAATTAKTEQGALS